MVLGYIRKFSFKSMKFHPIWIVRKSIIVTG